MIHPPVQLGPNFIRNIVDEDLASGKHKSVVTRFPPEPNGYLHIGHAKSICLNFGLAALYQGRCHLRFDDTNPVKEEQEYIDAIKTDVSWLGFDWGENEYHASDYFEALYAFAEKLVEKGLAFVCDLPPEEMREYRGTLTEPGKESPYRSRTVGENLDLLRRMRAGEFDDGSRVLRAKIDMAAPNMNLRDPVLYRILRATHPRTGDAWCIYPMYDFAHGQSDSLEQITHSLCTLEFQDHRPLYDWLCEALEIYHPQQIEFARLNLTYTVMSKRRLLELVNEKHVSGWDDPRMPTLSGMRRRGFTAAAIRTFCERIGVGKSDSVIDMSTLEDCVREDLDQIAPRAMGVLRPLKVTITNYPEGQSEEFTAPKHPKKPEMGSRTIPFGRVIYVDRDDFMEDPPKNFFRLGPDREVRLRYGYIIRCDGVIKDPVSGEVTELRCSYDAETGGGVLPEGRKKVKGIIHWVAAANAVSVEVRLYDRLLSVADPASEKDRDYRELLNQDSLEVLADALVEPELASAEAGESFQFERLGYFCVDGKGSQSDKLAFNRTVTLRDTWAKLAKG
ncbi:MAG: glutamine--tRNA ligase/YqeY domain fusion protein [Desulfuromonadales bacterium]|nr:glutamine--tRNA ligase/YqeY domain fusion protein [Desulfuromonadales bacterium]MDH3807496.1 glutamine--tRNA ligase/YqeY domain fusion protein [Desulfuromonadales bacterium]MDH4024334.1 glutamine--tRNA ligase/YqeY domain fusion protein [Desulfuromonadales bacterium]